MKNSNQIADKVRHQLRSQKQQEIATGRECEHKVIKSKPVAISSTVSVISILSDLYGKTWEVVHGKSDSDSLIRFLNSLTKEDAQRIFSHCREQVSNGNRWAPNLIELIAYRDSPTETEFFEVLSRVKNGNPETRIEKYLCENIRYNLRRLPVSHEMKFLKSQYRLAHELEKTGKLKTAEDELLALPRHSAKNLNDIHREKYDGEINPRILKIMESKK